MLLDGAVVAKGICSTWGAGGGGGGGFSIGLNDVALASGRNGVILRFNNSESLGFGFNDFVGTGRNLTSNGAPE